MNAAPTRPAGFHPPVLAADAVTKQFAKGDEAIVALRELSVTVAEGSFVTILGRSGCGKSTLLNMLAGLTAPSTGEIRYRDARLTGPNTQIGYLTQHDTLMPWRDVLRNVEMPLEIRGVDAAKRRAVATDLVQRVGLAGFEKHYPRELSGGMRRRAGLARMLAGSPETLLMDEPFGALDAQLRRDLRHGADVPPGQRPGEEGADVRGGAGRPAGGVGERQHQAPGCGLRQHDLAADTAASRGRSHQLYDRAAADPLAEHRDQRLGHARDQARHDVVRVRAGERGVLDAERDAGGGRGRGPATDPPPAGREPDELHDRDLARPLAVDVDDGVGERRDHVGFPARQVGLTGVHDQVGHNVLQSTTEAFVFKATDES
jgi:ABC-type nitrate/sulfonate/bicarbonate transport system ATPase subunit